MNNESYLLLDFDMKFLKGESLTSMNECPQRSLPPIVQDQENIPSLSSKNLPMEVQNGQGCEQNCEKAVCNKSKEQCMQAISPYKKEIGSYLLSLPKFGPFPVNNYFGQQQDITESMRRVLLNWLVDVHLKYKLIDETFFIAVNIIDQYLSVCNIQRSELQLLGITSLWIASKYEETYQVPKLSNLVFICDSAYTVREILQMEGLILQECQFNLLQPTSLNYFQLLNVDLQLDQKLYFLALYLMEIALFQIDMRRFMPSTVATSALYFIGKLINSKDRESTGSHFNYISKVLSQTAIDQNEVKSCARQLCILWHRACVGSSTSLRQKYASKAYHSVSKSTINEFASQNSKGSSTKKDMQVE